MEKQDNLAAVLRDTLAQLQRLDESAKKQAIAAMQSQAVLLAAIKALIASHPDHGALREHWNREISGLWSGLVLVQEASPHAKLLQAEIERTIPTRT